VKRKKLVAVACTAASVALVASACSSSSKTTSSSTTGNTTITVWMMTDAKTGWDKAVTNAIATFKSQHPGDNVNLQWKTWGTYLTQFSAAVKAGDEPDAMEVGNTQAITPIAGGAFTELDSAISSGTFPNSSTWNAGLKASCTYNGHVYCVPYYAADRMAGINPTQAAAVGITSAPTTWSAFTADIAKLNAKYGSTKGFNGFELEGGSEYTGLAFVKDAGGEVAVQSGSTWKAELESTASEKGLANYCSVFKASPNNSATGTDDNQDPAWSNGTAGMMYGLAWEWDNPPAGDTATSPTPAFYFNIPSPTTAGSYLPDFTGGSDLAVPSGAKNATLGEDWIADYTSSENEAVMAAAGDIPNSTSLTSDVSGAKNTQYASGQTNPFFVPTAQNWVKVDGGTPNLIDTMLESMTQNGCTASAIDSAAKTADAAIDTALNG